MTYKQMVDHRAQWDAKLKESGLEPSTADLGFYVPAEVIQLINDHWDAPEEQKPKLSSGKAPDMWMTPEAFERMMDFAESVGLDCDLIRQKTTRRPSPLEDDPT